MSIRKSLVSLTVALAVTAAIPAVQCFAILSPNLKSAVVYPNPFRPSLGHTAVTFNNLTASARLRVYKVSGELVYDAAITTTDGTFLWTAVNNDGDALATGVYVYLLTSNGAGKKTGKLAIVR